MVFFHHQVFSQGILKVLGPSFVELVFVIERMHPLGNFELQLVVSQRSKSNNVLVVIKNVTYCKEFSGILITVVNSNSSAADSNIESNSEIFWLEWHIRTILLDDHLSFKESTLRCTRIDLLWFCNEDGSVFKEVVNYHIFDSVIFKSTFDNAFFEITVKS